MMDQSEIEAVVKDLSVLEGLDLTYRSRAYSRYAVIEIDQTASAAIWVTIDLPLPEPAAEAEGEVE